MPGLDGFQTANLIRERAAGARVPIIFVTAINKDDSYVLQGYDVGAVDYLFKPFDPQVLRAKVAVFADLHRKTQVIQEQANLISAIRERERAHEVMRLEVESLRRYQNLADAIPHILWKTGPNGALIYCNKGWREYTGFDIEMNYDVRWREAFHAEDLKRLLKVWLESMKNGASFEMECRIARHDGAQRWHWLKAVAERAENGEVTAWIGTCTDIHDMKEYERRVVEARELAESANLAKTHFLANMSHEVRTPLSAILGFSELLLNAGPGLNEKIHFVNTIRNNGRQLLKIVDEVLDISKVEAGRLQIETIEIETKPFLNELFASLNLKAVEKGLDFRFRLVDAIPAVMATDGARLRQILENILANAIKFTDGGEVEALVAWLPESAGAKARLRVDVRDTGIGIDAKHIDKLFLPFAQADSSTTRRFGGTGLGLALSRRLSRALGGDVSLLASGAGGSTFRIEISPSSYSTTRFFSSLSHEEVDESGRRNADGPSLAGLRVLLAEDVAENQFLISRFLEMAGASVDVVANGLEAVHSARSRRYDVILMDIQMPDLDGYEATLRLRDAGYAMPIIALTAHALHEERERSLRSGFDDHLTKPVDRLALLESVQRHGRKASTPAPTVSLVN